MKSMICSLLIALPAISSADALHDDAVAAAQAATTAWLSLADQGRYDASWESAATLFQAAVTKADWQRSLNAVRAPLGDLFSREVAASEYRITLPGAPDGEYVVFSCNASFEHKAQATETVTAMRQADGEWRVAGYYIK